jgi:serine/threonine protein kinase
MSMDRVLSQSQPDGLPILPVAGDTAGGRYHILSELGRGGMGVVLAAHDLMLDREVALKVVLPWMMASQEVVDRFTNEARSLAQMESRHVVKCLDFGIIAEPSPSAGLPFMVLELLRGQDLYAYASEHGSLSPERVVRFALEACNGLAAAHAVGIIHRDLKPENLFVTVEPDGTECLKVLDFGVARGGRGRVVTADQASVGSPGYMAPEQIEGGAQVDARADIWALGVVMYELLAHQPVFAGESAQSLCLQILSAPIVPLDELCPDLPPALVYVIERCLERDPDQRFQNVAELADALAPLDDWSPTSDAERIRQRLDAGGAVLLQPVRRTPVQPLRHLSSGAIRVVRDVRSNRSRSKPPIPRKRRRAISTLAVALTLVPAGALLPSIAQAPELATARAWSSRAVLSTQLAWFKAYDAAKDFWATQASAERAPAEQQQQRLR